MPGELAGGRYPSNGLYPHRSQADRGLVIDPGCRTPATPTPAGSFRRPKGAGCGGMNLVSTLWKLLVHGPGNREPSLKKPEVSCEVCRQSTYESLSIHR